MHADDAGGGISRREALKRLGGGAGLLALGPVVRWRTAPAPFGSALEVRAMAVSAATLRLTIRVVGDAAPIPVDGALVSPERPAGVRLARGEPAHVGSFTASVTDAPLRIRIGWTSRLVQELELSPDGGALSFALGTGPLLGLGQGGVQFDRRGSVDPMESGQGGYRLRTHGARVPIQWLVSTDGWALYVHRPLGAFDLSGERGRFQAPAEAALPLDLFLVVGEPATLMDEWARLTGYPELPPLWSLGYQQSHRTLSGPDEVMWVARTMREKRLPCDTLIYLGTGFCPSGWNTQNGEFTWNPAVFPDPAGALRSLHDLHYRVVLHAVLEGRRLLGAVHDPCPAPPAPGATGSGNDWPDEQRVACYWPIHKPIVEQGIDGWWPDQGDDLDAPSRLARIRMYYEGMQLYRPDERPFALHRNGYAGMGRYAAFLWSGDVYSTWETLKTHVAVAINSGLSGIPFWGTDIGGFVPTPEYTGELHVRWFQFGAFCPLFRAHGRTWHLRLPWGWNTGELGHDEVVGYRGGAGDPDPSELHNAAVEPICRKYLELRYRLLPYLYTAVREAHDAGLPILRALWLHYPHDPQALARGDEYLWGRDLLVAPVVEKGAAARELYLPPGDWYDFWTEQPIAGGRILRRAVDLETMPLYVRAGTVLPLGPVRQYTTEPVDAPLTLVVYPGRSAEASVYEDDGRSFAYRRGDWTRTLFRWDDARRTLRVYPGAGSRPRTPPHLRIEVRVAGQPGVRHLMYEGAPIQLTL
jgi:alpha-glucosidase/alpha-D-xyloside xylohydrolase